LGGRADKRITLRLEYPFAKHRPRFAWEGMFEGGNGYVDDGTVKKKSMITTKESGEKKTKFLMLQSVDTRKQERRQKVDMMGPFK